jgi:hypothetical protein
VGVRVSEGEREDSEKNSKKKMCGIKFFSSAIKFQVQKLLAFQVHPINPQVRSNDRGFFKILFYCLVLLLSLVRALVSSCVETAIGQPLADGVTSQLRRSVYYTANRLFI